MTIEWEGLDKFQRFLRDTPKIVLKDVEAALTQEGENIMGDSKEDTPVALDGGTLRASGHVKDPKTKRGKTEVILGYGTKYAVAVHETPSKHDPPSWVGKTITFNVGGPKFLEKAMKKAAKGFGGRMIKKALRSLRERT